MLLALWICIPTSKSFIHLDPQVSSFTGSMWALDDHTQNLSNSKKQGLFHVVIDPWHKLGNKTTVIPQTEQNDLPHLLCLTDGDEGLGPGTVLPLKSNTFAYYPLYANYIETSLKGIPKLLVSVAMVPTFFFWHFQILTVAHKLTLLSFKTSPRKLQFTASVLRHQKRHQKSALLYCEHPSAWGNTV